MKKREFIKELKDKLSVLEENEINDIVLEYTGIIEDKVKAGQKEIDAIKDFGDIDELAKEILKAYKINPKYAEKKSSTGEVVDNIEGWIRKGAKKLSEVTKKIFEDAKNDDNVTIEGIFEIIIKVLILLVLISLLRIPFHIIDALGQGLFGIAFHPFDVIIIGIWKLLIWVLYIVVCIFVGFAMFKNNIRTYKFSGDKKEAKKIVKEVEDAVEEIEEAFGEIEKKSKPKKSKAEKVKEDKIVEESNLGSAVSLVGKIFVVVFFLIPLWSIIVGLSIALVVMVYYLIVGINLWGIILLLMGLLIIFGHITVIFNSFIFKRKKIRLYPFLVGVIVLCFGTLITFHTVRNFTFNEGRSNINFEITTSEFTVDIRNRSFNIFGNREYIIDEDLEDNIVIVQVTYFNDIVQVHTSSEADPEFHIWHFSNLRSRNFWIIYDDIIENLKRQVVYDYSFLNEVEYTIFANENTMSSIRIVY